MFADGNVAHYLELDVADKPWLRKGFRYLSLFPVLVSITHGNDKEWHIHMDNTYHYTCSTQKSSVQQAMNRAHMTIWYQWFKKDYHRMLHAFKINSLVCTRILRCAKLTLRRENTWVCGPNPCYWTASPSETDVRCNLFGDRDSLFVTMKMHRGQINNAQSQQFLMNNKAQDECV